MQQDTFHIEAKVNGSKIPTLKVTNIKCSVKIPCKLSLNDLRKRCCYDFNLTCIPYPNFIVIKKPSSSLRIVFFKEKAYSKSASHANITGLNSITDVESCINYLAEIVGCSHDEIIYKIDNISGVTDVVENILESKKIEDLNLTKLSQFVDRHSGVKVRFNPESFACMISRLDDCTILLYGKGKVVLIGSHSIGAMKFACQWLKEVVESAIKAHAL